MKNTTYVQLLVEVRPDKAACLRPIYVEHSIHIAESKPKHHYTNVTIQ